MHVYLPDDLYKQVKTHRLPISALLQKALRAELHQRELAAETDRYVAELVSEVRLPTAVERTRAGAVARRLAQHPTRQGS